MKRSAGSSRNNVTEIPGRIVKLLILSCFGQGTLLVEQITICVETFWSSERVSDGRLLIRTYDLIKAAEARRMWETPNRSKWRCMEKAYV